jgi:SAM-dependent methyltransferase
MHIDLDQLLRTLSNAGRRAVGLPVRIDTEDRRLLERTILPAYAARDDIRRVLFVGCAPYTRQYQQIFRSAEYWTIDPAPSRARYGGKPHIVAPLQSLDRHAPAGIFDLIVCNGVLGWGLNTVDDAERAFQCCEDGLRVGGELIVGWNDVPGRNDVRPEKIGALRNFERHPCAAVGAVRMIVAGRHRHVFDFYRRRSRPAIGARSRSAAEAQEAMAVASGGPGK